MGAVLGGPTVSPAPGKQETNRTPQERPPQMSGCWAHGRGLGAEGPILLLGVRGVRQVAQESQRPLPLRLGVVLPACPRKGSHPPQREVTPLFHHWHWEQGQKSHRVHVRRGPCMSPRPEAAPHQGVG